MESFCIALLSLLIINPFLPYLGLSDINPLATVISLLYFQFLFFLLIILTYVISRFAYLRCFYMVCSLLIIGFYSLIAFLQGPLYLFIYFIFLTDFRCRLFVNSFFDGWAICHYINALYVLGVEFRVYLV